MLTPTELAQINASIASYKNIIKHLKKRIQLLEAQKNSEAEEELENDWDCTSQGELYGGG